MSSVTEPTDEQRIAAVKAAARRVRERVSGHDPDQQVRREAVARSIVIDTIGTDSEEVDSLTDKAIDVADGHTVEVGGIDIGPLPCLRCGSSVCEGGNWCDEPIPGDHYAGEDARVGSIEDLDPMAVER